MPTGSPSRSSTRPTSTRSRPLWKALLDHIAALPDAIVPIRPFEESWPLERQEMLETLAGDAFVLVARRGGDVVGYAFVAIEGPDPVWYTGDKRAELRHLSVADGERGNGVGTALLDAMDDELERRGVEDVEIGVDTGQPRRREALREPRLPRRLPHLLRLAGQEAVGLPAREDEDRRGRARPLRAARPRGARRERAPLRQRDRRQPRHARAGREGRGARRAPRGARLRRGLRRRQRRHGGRGARREARTAASRSASCRRPIAGAPPPTSPTPCAAPWATRATSAWWPAATW